MATCMISAAPRVALAGFVRASTEGVKVKPSSHYRLPIKRSSFPDGFIFGAGSAAYQTEGAAKMDNRGPSIWDTFTREQSEKITDRSNGDVAEDFYHRYKEDITLMKEIGLDSFRFSISWSRLFPKGRISEGVNPLGLRFYNNLIDELLSNGIKPFVTLLHFDPPQALEDEYGGFLDPRIVQDFADYADFCFETFGNRVKMWVTLNEPNMWSIGGYDKGIHAPGRCSRYVGNCSAGNSAIEPYIVAHHLLLAHAAAVKLYKDKYQARHKGQIGITLVTHWFEPKFPTDASRYAASRALDFMFGWFAGPVMFGDYPESMKSSVGNRLPKFSEVQSELLKGSIDFLGLNYYTANYAEPAPFPSDRLLSYDGDRRATLTTSDKNGNPIGIPTALDWLFIYPKGIHDLLLYIKKHYNNPPIIITENGTADDSTLPIEDALMDAMRKSCIHDHLSNILQAIKEGVHVKGYYVWSFLDDFEWSSGYTVRFGLTFVDFENNLRRSLKDSAHWFKMFLLK